MCRIAGIVNAEEGSFETRYMCDEMRRGGPDDEGFYSDPDFHVSLGHRRLSIIDLSSAGHQPMISKDGSVVMVYNGELYNYLELKAELQNAGIIFSTRTDTEVILEAYRFWGVTCFSRFNGMFAIGLLDRSNKKFILARDSAAIKPLYYSFTNGRLYFASELRAFRRLGKWSANDKWKVFFLAFGHLPEPITTLKEVQPLNQGHYLQMDLVGGAYEIKKFYSDPHPVEYTSYDAAIAALRDALPAAVRRHLISDAPIGLFLSGGIDSSILTTLASEFAPIMLKTLSVYFDSEKYSEEYYQQLVVARTGVKHAQFKVSQEEFREKMPDIHLAMDSPSIDGINSYFISHFARVCGLKAVLSGLGADELLGGYASFRRAGWVPGLKAIPASLKNLAGKFSNAKLKRLSFLSLEHPVGEYLFYRGIFSLKEISRLLGISVGSVIQELESLPDPQQEFQALRGAERAGYLEYNYYMKNQLLRDTDYMSMWHGLEVRVPFLDKEFISTCDQIAAAIRFSGARPKQILIDAFSKILPEEVWNRRKSGFTFPFEEWFRKDPDFLQGVAIPNWIREDFSRGTAHWSKMWALEVLSQFD